MIDYAKAATRNRIAILCGALLIVLMSASAQAAVKSNDLVEHAKEYDGRRIAFKGEVIGDVMRRGKEVWLNVNDGTYAIGVWGASSLADQIRYAGSYAQSGDIVEVTGIFHRACPQHGGDMDIHAGSLMVLEQGHPVTHLMDQRRALVAVALCLVALALIGATRWRKPPANGTGESFL